MAIERYHQALGYTLLAYMTLVIAVVTLIPFAFAVPKTIQFTFRGNTSDVFTNVVLFVPLGFFFQITYEQAGLKSILGAVCFGLVVSCSVEVGQLFLPSRCSSVIDVITNGTGAWVGAAIAGYHQWMVRQGRMPELFGFGLPLISSVYLLIPLLWLGGLSMGTEMARLGLLGLVGVYGGGVISSAVVNRFKDSMRRARFAVFGNATGWFMIGAAPAFTHFRIAVLVLSLGVGVAAQLSCRIWKKKNPTERRFELPTLKRLLPIYLFYLLLLSVWPTTVPLSEWPRSANFQLLDQGQRVLFVFRFVEVIAAFTLLGYLVAEMSGRKNETGLNSLLRVALYVMVVAISTSTLRNARLEPLYIFMEAVIFTIAAIYGSIIFRLQLSAVRQRKEKQRKVSSDGMRNNMGNQKN